MEMMEEDAKQFKELSNLEEDSSVLAPTNHEPKLVEAKEFWESIEPELIEKLGDDFAYKYDLEMFDYSIEEYLERIGVEFHSKKLQMWIELVYLVCSLWCTIYEIIWIFS